MTTNFAFGLGLSRHSASGTMLDCYFPQPILNPQGKLLDALSELSLGAQPVTSDQALALDSAHRRRLTASQPRTIEPQLGRSEVG